MKVQTQKGTTGFKISPRSQLMTEITFNKSVIYEVLVWEEEETRFIKEWKKFHKIQLTPRNVGYIRKSESTIME